MKHFLFALFAFASLVVQAQSVLDLTSGSQSNGVTNEKPVRTFEATDNGYKVTYTFNKANIKPDNGAYEISFPDFGQTHQVAMPSLPVKSEEYIVPDGKVAKVSVVSSDYSDIAIELAPAKPMLTDTYGDDEPSITPISDYAGFYPTDIVSMPGAEYYRSAAIVNTTVYPVQYNMREKKARVYKNIVFKVEFVTAPSKAQGGGEDVGIVRYNFTMIDFDNKELFGGYGSVDYLYDHKPKTGTNVKKDYLIISSPVFMDAVDKFVEWKTKLGYNMSVSYSNNWNSASIKDSIGAYTEKHPDFTYLLILGSNDIIPGMYYDNNQRDWFVDDLVYNGYYSDLPYACLNGDSDTYPDVYYGRIPATDLTEANTIVDKIIDYEKNPPTHDTFYNTASFSGLMLNEEENAPKNNTESRRGYNENCESIRARLNQKGFLTKFNYRSDMDNPLYWNSGQPIPQELQRPNYQWDGDNYSISTAINDGVFVHLHRGHGMPTYWQDVIGMPFYHVSDINSLHNGKLLPTVFSITCLTGRPIPGYKSFAESFICKDNGGCNAIIAATDVSKTYHNNYFAEGLYAAMWPKDSPLDGSTEIGRILHIGHVIANHYFENNNDIKTYQRRIYHCYGDPSMRVFTSAPKKVEGVTVDRSNNRLHVKCNKNMYISIYDKRTKTSNLFYGSDYEVMCVQSLLDPELSDSPHNYDIWVYEDNYKPEEYRGYNKFIVPSYPKNEIDLGLSSPSRLRISNKSDESETTVNLIISDISGNQVLKREGLHVDGNVEIELEALKGGIYVATVEQDGEKIKTCKFTK